MVSGHVCSATRCKAAATPLPVSLPRLIIQVSTSKMRPVGAKPHLAPQHAKKKVVFNGLKKSIEPSHEHRHSQTFEGKVVMD